MRPLLQRHLLCSTPSPAALCSPSCLPAAPGDLGVLILPAHSPWCLAGGPGVGGGTEATEVGDWVRTKGWDSGGQQD